MRFRTMILAGGFLAACSPETAPPEGPSPFPNFLDLQTYFDCIGERGLTQIAAHRGGPSRGYPENALETFEHTFARTGAFLEVDVSTSADGVLYLHHDDTLGRTTTGKGPSDEKTWDELKDLSLKDNDGRVTAYGLTRLDEALAWADGKTVLELDIKRSTDYDDVARVVREADAEDRVILIAYTENSALALARRFPNSMISVTVESVEELESLLQRGLKAENILAWTGTETPDPALTEALGQRGIEVIFGTLGGRDSLDHQYEEAGTDGEYTRLSEYGIDLIATDRPVPAANALKASGRMANAEVCATDG